MGSVFPRTRQRLCSCRHSAPRSCCSFLKMATRCLRPQTNELRKSFADPKESQEAVKKAEAETWSAKNYVHTDTRTIVWVGGWVGGCVNNCLEGEQLASASVYGRGSLARQPLAD
jgi:hypothetical protein